MIKNKCIILLTHKIVTCGNFSFAVINTWIHTCLSQSPTLLHVLNFLFWFCCVHQLFWGAHGFLLLKRKLVHKYISLWQTFSWSFFQTVYDEGGWHAVRSLCFTVVTACQFKKQITSNFFSNETVALSLSLLLSLSVSGSISVSVCHSLSPHSLSGPFWVWI